MIEGMGIDLSKLIGETTDYDKKQQLEIRKPKSWCKSISAFANGSGGFLIFGITNDDTVVGVEDAHRAGEKLSETIKDKLDPIPTFRLSYETVDDKTLMIVAVEPGDMTPYYYIGDGQQIAFYRMGNESIPAGASKLRELVLRGTHQTYDSLPTDYKFENHDFSKLRSVFNHRTGKEFTENDYESWGLITPNGKLTNAGALLANENPLRHSRLFCTRWNGLDQSHGIMDALDDQEISGSLIQQLQEGLSFVRRNSKKMWHKSSDGRVELPDYPEDSILEGLVNALIHRSYIELGSEVHLDMFDDRIEIFSPGGMYECCPVQDCDIMKIKSRRRNPVLADIFSRLKYMERRGSGFKKICHEYTHHVNYREDIKPEFFSDNNDFVLTLFNLNYGIEADANEDNHDANLHQTAPNTEETFTDLHQTAPNCTKLHQLDSELNYNLRTFLKVVKNFPGASAVLLAVEAHVSERTAKSYLKKLQELGIIRRVGTNRKGYWEISQDNNTPDL